MRCSCLYAEKVQILIMTTNYKTHTSKALKTQQNKLKNNNVKDAMPVYFDQNGLYYFLTILKQLNQLPLI